MRAAGTGATKSWSTGRGPSVEVASQLGGKGRPGLGMGRPAEVGVMQQA